MYYMENPKLEDEPRLVQEIIDLYDAAKATEFMKMEGIIRKLDQLSIALERDEFGVPPPISKRREIANIAQDIEELKKRAEKYLNSISGKSLPEKTQKALITFTNYLNHPDIRTRPQLFQNMLDKYEAAEEIDFIQMQAFNDLLTMIEIKLGQVSDEMKTYKTMDERIQELKEAKEKIAAEWETIEEERSQLALNQKSLEVDKNNLEVEKKKLEAEIEEIKIKLEEDRKKLVTEVEDAKIKLEEEKKKLEAESEKIEAEKMKLESDRKLLEDEKRNL